MYFPTHSCIYHIIASIDHFTTFYSMLLNQTQSVAFSLAVDGLTALYVWARASVKTPWSVSGDWGRDTGHCHGVSQTPWPDWQLGGGAVRPHGWRGGRHSGRAHMETRKQGSANQIDRVKLNKLAQKMYATYLEFYWKGNVVSYWGPNCRIMSNFI